MVRGAVIPAAAEAPVELREFSRLKDYQAAVGGRIEAVDLRALGVTIYVNEQGLIEQLPFNSRASFLWWYYVPEVRHRTMLVGDAVVVGLPDRDGGNTDLAPTAVELLAGDGPWKVEVKTVGDPKWYGNQMTYTDYFEALVWAMLALERWAAAEDVRVVPVGPGTLERGAA